MSGEYAVLDGARSLALPTKLGQKMTIKSSRGSDLIWECLDKDGNTWFSSHISLYDFSAVKTTDHDISDHLQKVLKNAVRLNSEFLSKWNGFKVETQLQFDRLWGLGSSSSLISLVAQWADINPLMLYFKVGNGSGCDVACSDAGTPIVYFSNEVEVSYSPVDFNPKFKKNLFFVHLNEKQDSKQGIKSYLKAVKNKKELVKTISSITDDMAVADSLSSFTKLVDSHEATIAKHTGFSLVKDDRFSDFWGSIKSLGAWGGDFAMAISDKDAKATKTYFDSKGYTTCLSFDDLF